MHIHIHIYIYEGVKCSCSLCIWVILTILVKTKNTYIILAQAWFILDHGNTKHNLFSHGNFFTLKKIIFFCSIFLDFHLLNATSLLNFDSTQKEQTLRLTPFTRVGVHTSRESRMRFGRCSGLITLPHLTCISEAWNLIRMQLLFSITVWESWTQGLRSHYPGGRGVLEGGGRETEEGQRGRWCIMNWHFWGCSFSKSKKMSRIKISEIPIHT